jgi:tetratricopeptide (TPR) repeat protein
VGRRPPARSRWPVYLGAACVPLVLAGLYVLLAHPSTTPPAGATRSEAGQQIGALTEALVANQVQLARKKLEDKNYAAAAAQAERALKLDPQSADAKQVFEQARGSLKQLDDAAVEAKRALNAGDLDKAAEALWRVLSANPGHSSVEELMGPLDGSFRGRSEEARRLMVEARNGAERAKAGVLEVFSLAAGQAKEGEALLAKGAFAQAARRFLEARDGFDRARHVAQR